MYKMALLQICLSLALLSSTLKAAPLEDLIVDLPGLNYAINFKQYSGYLNGTIGRKLHYWFVESQGNPMSDPLLLWLNGGPGCSSLDGFLAEHGPFKVGDDQKTLIENNYSWNKRVGFSYDEDDNCLTNDNEVASMNYFALQHFMEKFPEYKDHDFYITGESYGGIYVPTLSVLVVDGQDEFPINFRGFAIGNGLLSYQTNQDSLMFFGYYHAILGEDLWADLVRECCQGVESRETCDFFVSVTAKCELAVLKATDLLYYQGLNMYDLEGTCETPSTASNTASRYNFDVRNIFLRANHGRPEPYLEPPCIDSSKETYYLNQPDVRNALHIPEFVQGWEICSDIVSKTYVRLYLGVHDQLLYLHQNVRGLIYNGDVDMACNFLGNEWDVSDLKYNVTERRRKWVANNNVGGFVIGYENLDFLTVRGAGHMVPEDKPLEALQMITSFLRNEPY